MKIAMSVRLAAIALLALGSLTYSAFGSVRASSSHDAGLSKIEHIVIIVQENRSFNNLFLGFPNASSSTTGKLPNGQTIALREQPLATTWDISHGLQDAKTAYDSGKMDGFADEYSKHRPLKDPNPQYAYVPRSEVGPYWEMAQQYVLADNMFASQLDGSYVAHQYLISGWAGGAFNYPAVAPWGCDAPSGNAIGVLNAAGQAIGIAFPCFKYKTIADELDGKSISWRSYSPRVTSITGYSWDGYDAIDQIREGPDWKRDIVFPETRILHDVENGKLAAVTWVIPSLLLSDHAGSNSKRGPSWVASVVNAIGESKFWSSTAIFVTWDDWGGWYDEVPPPQLDYDGLGMRVPLICISPFAKLDHVDHTQYEFGSLLKLIEKRFDLPSLGRTDERSAAPLNCFDFDQKPRTFQKIQAAYTVEDIIAHATNTAPDDQ